jgi:hypothetical protein
MLLAEAVERPTRRAVAAKRVGTSLNFISVLQPYFVHSSFIKKNSFASLFISYTGASKSFANASHRESVVQKVVDARTVRTRPKKQTITKSRSTARKRRKNHFYWTMPRQYHNFLNRRIESDVLNSSLYYTLLYKFSRRKLLFTFVTII